MNETQIINNVVVKKLNEYDYLLSKGKHSFLYNSDVKGVFKLEACVGGVKKVEDAAQWVDVNF